MKRFKMTTLILFLAVCSISRVSAQEASSQDDQAFDDQINTLQEDVTRLQDIAADKDLIYRRTMHKMLIELFDEKIATAQKAGDTQTVNRLQDEIKNLTTIRDSTWDQKDPILDDQQKIYMLKLDKVSATIQKALAKSGELNEQKVSFLKETQAILDKLRPLYVQRYQLWKDLGAARKVEDFKTADDIYQKLKDSRQQERTIRANEKKEVLQMLDKSPALSPQNL